MRTQCKACAKEFTKPEVAELHYRAKHRTVRERVGGKINNRFVTHWPEDDLAWLANVYFDGETWGDYADRPPTRKVPDLTPQNEREQRAVTAAMVA